MITAYEELGLEDKFFTAYFNTLMGNSWVKEDIIKGVPEAEIRSKWESDLIEFKKTRKNYLLYPDFE